MAVLEFEDPFRDLVQEVPVVRRYDHRSRVVFQVVFDPVDRFGIEMVRGFVEKQQVGLLEKDAAESDPAAFASGKLVDDHFVGRKNQGVGCHVQAGVDLPAAAGIDLFLKDAHALHGLVHFFRGHFTHPVGEVLILAEQLHGIGKSQLEILPNGFSHFQLGFLGDETDLHASGWLGLPLELLVDACHNPQDRGLSGSVLSDDPDLGSREETQVDVAQNLLLPIEFVQTKHREDVLVGHSLPSEGDFRSRSQG